MLERKKLINRGREEDIFDFHADDYGISLNASEKIIELLKNDELDSISIIPNMDCFLVCMERFKQFYDQTGKLPQISIHINFMEGKSCLSKQQIPDLVDMNSYFNVSWGSLLFYNYNILKRSTIRKQLTLEIKEQIQIVIKQLPNDYVLRVDSHQHTHMIPIVFEALLQAMKELAIPVEFVRIAKEPIKPFLSLGKLIKTVAPTNIVKNLLLNYYSRTALKKLKSSQINTKLLWGIILSGNMDYERCERLYMPMLQYAKTHDMAMEVLFHPGSVEENEITQDYTKKGFVDFHRSIGRDTEFRAIQKLNQVFRS